MTGRSVRSVIRLFAGAVFLLMACTTAYAQATASALLRPERIEAGDTTSLWIMVSGVQAEPGQVDFGTWANLIPSANILDRSDWRRSEKQWVRRYTLISFDSATLELPPATVRLSIGDPVATNSLRLTVLPVPDADALEDMEVIRDIRREPTDWTDYWLWGAGMLVLFILIVWVIRKMTKRPAPTVAIAPPPPVQRITPYEHALKQLDELKRSKAWKQGGYKDYYTALDLIFREYLQAGYGIPAPESTTSELAALLKSAGFPQELLPVALEMLARTDLVKYARSHPAEQVHEKTLEDTRLLIVKSHNAREKTAVH